MKSGIFVGVIVLLLVVGCSKNESTNNVSSVVSAMSGNYNMNDTLIDYNNVTTATSYIMTVAPLVGTTDRAVFYNIGNQNHQDTAIVSGNVANFVNGWYGVQNGLYPNIHPYQYNTTAATASLSGTKITMSGGEIYSLSSGDHYHVGLGSKQ